MTYSRLDDARALVAAIPAHPALDALADKFVALTAERDKWKALAEFHYGMKAYPQDVGLGHGALDAFFRREWDNGRYEVFLEQAEQAAARSLGGIR